MLFMYKKHFGGAYFGLNGLDRRLEKYDFVTDGLKKNVFAGFTEFSLGFLILGNLGFP